MGQIKKCCWCFSDPNVVVAAPRQHGNLNSRTSLNCTSMLDNFQNMIIYEWFRGSGGSKVPLKGWPEFLKTNHSHQGLYTCQVYISSVDIKIEKIVEFLVAGKSKSEEMYGKSIGNFLYVG